MERKLLVVCVGNICRSPMAQVVLRRDLAQGWSVSSAGLGALVGEPAAPEALLSLQAKGLDATEHRARQVTTEMLREAELVFVMENAQKSALEKSFPWACGRVFRLGHWDDLEIADPYRRPQAVFDATLEAIVRCCTAWAPKLA